MHKNEDEQELAETGSVEQLREPGFAVAFVAAFEVFAEMRGVLACIHIGIVLSHVNTLETFIHV